MWTNKQELWNELDDYDQQITTLYRNMDQANSTRPNVAKLKQSRFDTIHKLEMSYGTTGSLFRSGSRQTFFASQVMRFADIYAASPLNLLYYPTFYMFRSPPMLLAHESTVSHVPGVTNGSHGVTQDQGQEARLKVKSGQEPGTTHDMDDDDFDYNDEAETSSDQSN